MNLEPNKLLDDVTTASNHRNMGSATPIKTVKKYLLSEQAVQNLQFICDKIFLTFKEKNL